MAVMTSPQRAEAWADMMREMSDERETVTIVKPDLRAALDAADQWVSDNAASFNTALPVAARNGLTATQKARLLVWVVRKRFQLGT